MIDYDCGKSLTLINFSRIPVGSYTNIESRESPLCSIADENETSKLTYKKSVFKKKSTSSTATVSCILFIDFVFN